MKTLTFAFAVLVVFATIDLFASLMIQDEMPLEDPLVQDQDNAAAGVDLTGSADVVATGEVLPVDTVPFGVQEDQTQTWNDETGRWEAGQETNGNPAAADALTPVPDTDVPVNFIAGNGTEENPAAQSSTPATPSAPEGMFMPASQNKIAIPDPPPTVVDPPTSTVTPEPATLLVMGLGLFGVAAARKLRRK